MLAFEIMRRAAHDWVLYRDSQKPQQKLIADDAYHWIFVEAPGSEAWEERVRSQKQMTSFCAVCEILGEPPEVVRSYIKRLTVKEILSTGRPPTYRRQKERRKRDRVVPSPIPAVQVATAPAPVLRPAAAISVVAKAKPKKIPRGKSATVKPESRMRVVIASPTGLVGPTSIPIRMLYEQAVHVAASLKQLAQILG
jgi:hypothetical protein